ncbi:MAG TPA: MBL fold metallo-hydrolase [Chitinophaga sp.]|uniref:MBL fold metallo-hydrolase n=1 Tax=Chitinophaga sp. TaxID=1869181 RepID=UPI002C68865C|nr:MBL fold metallo-hydrolase [Chitinophaga sp.]HVI44210.1 MBL fold metallo-hydrolase [Chitinophaga sp.]
MIEQQLGKLELTILSDGSQLMKTSHPTFGPYTDPATVKQLLRDHHRPTEAVSLGLHILLIRKGDRLIMADSGLGNLEPTSGRLPQALAAAGIQANDITDIVLTHGHLDHIGGLITPAGQPAYPSATIHLAQTEYNCWMQPNPDFSASAMKDDADTQQYLVNHIRRILTAIQPQLRLIQHHQTLHNCIRFVAAPGHTPGHTVLQIYSGNEELWHLADVVHSDVLLVPHPEWGFFFDTDFHLACNTRISMLSMLADTGKPTLAYHLPWPGLGYVRRNGTAFEWIPVAFVTPEGE